MTAPCGKMITDACCSSRACSCNNGKLTAEALYRDLENSSNDTLGDLMVYEE
jgi:hypothetical protein